MADVVPLAQANPATTFVLMYIAWPQQEQLLALAKHQPNVVVDLMHGHAERIFPRAAAPSPIPPSQEARSLFVHTDGNARVRVDQCRTTPTATT